MSEPVLSDAQSRIGLEVDLSAYTPEQQQEIQRKLARIHGLSFDSIDAFEIYLKSFEVDCGRAGTKAPATARRLQQQPRRR
jgi:hypothetical protein